MAKSVSLVTADGGSLAILPEAIASGAMKDVYLSTDKTKVAAFFRKPLGASARDRLANIAGPYRKAIFDQPEGEYWRKLFCWPEQLVEWEGRQGVVCPIYDRDFFFSAGKFRGREKEGKWFASARLRNRFLEPEQLGTWLSHLQICLNLARGVRRMHAAGLAHSDLSYKNVLVDPLSGRACIIDIDGLVVPGKYPPDVVGTPDFIAPEVMATRNLPAGDPGRVLPSILTDRHALPTLIYMYLLYRHPLRGPLVHDLDPARDEELSMGSRALFIEHPADRRNHVIAAQLEPGELPQGDPDKLPYTITGPYLSGLFRQAFIDGLHNPSQRPPAANWEAALVKTLDLLQPCQNPDCPAHWYVFDNRLRPVCPFCGTPYQGQLPVLNLYWSPRQNLYKPENHRLMVYDRQSLYMWHVNRTISPNEKADAAARKPVGDFHFHKNRWILINRALPDMHDKTLNRKIGIGEAVTLDEGRKILLSGEDGGRLAVVQLVNPA